MDLLTRVLQRHSTPSRLLSEPGPDEAQLARILEAAVHVPDHGRLSPWRFIAVRGEQRPRLGNVLARRRIEREPDATPAVVEKDRLRFEHAPLVIVVVARLTPRHKVPEQEQLLSGGAACFSILLAADALGFGAQWLTGWAAYDPVVAATLGLSAAEHVIGFIHIGTRTADVADRDRPAVALLLSEATL